MTELGEIEFVSSVTTIATVLNTDRERMVAMGILLIIDYGTYVCVFNVYSSVFE